MIERSPIEFVEQPKRAERVEHAPKSVANGRTVTVANRVGRNEKCPCASGKKYKHCCLVQPVAESGAVAG